MFPNLLVFLLFIAAGIFGTPVGNRNIMIIFVWILWWFLLIAAMVPFASRIWCAMCPFPFFGEWFQRRALVRVAAIDPKKEKKGGPGVLIGRNRYFGLNRRWPKALSNIWIQNFLFLALCTFSALFLTRPIVSVVVLASIFLTATIFHLLYRQRAFCNYVCPVSGFLSLYSMASMVEVRSRDREVCDQCKEKACLAGSERGWGCPWFMYPSKMERNNYCGLCMECVKACPHDNMTVNLRSFCSDTKLKGYDEAWKAFIMLSLATTYSIIYLGPWGFLKDWANIAESRDWGGFLAYTAALWVSALLLIPAIYYAAVWIGKRLAGSDEVSFKDAFLGLAYPLVPLGLLAWIAFSFPLMLVNGSYILMTLSDPFGWGWDLFGTSHVTWTPIVPHWTPHIQVLFLLVGLFYALKTGYAQARKLFGGEAAVKAFAPVAILLTACVSCFMWLYGG
ncbi:MAG: 4Fe-4S binding protein [Acidobacteria bacterium]|nr:4Fe-4S binding protein [Acidobacteriota bacterium]